MRKVLVTGASGLLGREILKQCKNCYDETIGIAYSRAKDPLIKCDLTKPGEIENLIRDVRATFIIHSAAERSPDKVEKDYEATRLLNIETSRRLAKVAREVGSRIIYISTDYVFDGTAGPYLETCTPHPTNKYGLTKFEGEQAMLEENPDVLILRIPVLYGPVENLNESAVTSLLNCLLTKKEMSVSHYEKRYPSHVLDISLILVALLQLLEKDPSLKGIFHWSGKEQLTKYEMVQEMALVFSLSCEHIKPDPNPAPGAPRPYDSRLKTSRLEELGIGSHTQFKCGIEECLRPWVAKQRETTL